MGLAKLAATCTKTNYSCQPSDIQNDIHFNRLFDFFVSFLVLYAFFSPVARRYFILIASYVFYGYYEPSYVFLLFGSSYLDFRLAQKIYDTHDAVWKKRYLLISMVVNFGVLFIFKYFNFFLEVSGGIVGREFFRVDLILPIGISFYTFQTVSYCVDVYRNEVKPERNLVNFLIYVSFFPQLIAGPIERAKNLLSQIQVGPQISWLNFKQGIFLICYGLFIKLAIANNLTSPVLTIVQTPNGYGNTVLVFVGVLFLFKLYADFLGYTEIARGIALLMGYRLSANFRRPFFATSTREFWQRWHISLTSWIGDYVNAPLRERLKHSRLKRYIVVFVMVLVGLWHGAGWNFFYYGLIQGLTMLIWHPVAGVLIRLFSPNEGVKKACGWFFMYFSIWACGPLFFISDFPTYMGYLAELFNFDEQSEFRSIPGKLELIAAGIGIVLMLSKDAFEERSNSPLFENAARYGRWTFIFFVVFLILLILALGRFTNEEFIYYAF